MTIDSGVRVGKYEVGRKLGQGGFGLLHVARDSELGREIAIKFLRPEHAFRPAVVQRFLQEARAAARINHPGIVTVFESGIVSEAGSPVDGTVYIAMELLTGETLATRIKQHGRLPTPLALNYARQLASALGAAHQAGIVHRDLKPANVFLVPDPAVVGGERVKVLDFGIAKLADDFGSNVQTHSMLMLGTPMYMSPEQCKSSAKVDARSDIYSLGCILFEMLCGRPPFDGDSGELIAKHQLVDPPTPRSLRGEVPADLDRLVTSMLAKPADERPQTMALVESALADIETEPEPEPVVGATIEDAPTRVEVRGLSMLRDRWPLFAAAAAAVAIGVTFAVVSMSSHDKSASAARAPVAGDAAVAVVAPPVEPPPPPMAPSIDAMTVEPTVPGEATEIAVECAQDLADRKWRALGTCADRLAPQDAAKASELRQIATMEADAEIAFGQLQALTGKQDLAKARKQLDRIDPASVYRLQAEQLIDDLTPHKSSASSKKAKEIAGNGCNADALRSKGEDNANAGLNAAALAKFEASLKCENDPQVVALAFMAACNSHNATKANRYFAQLDAPLKDKYRQICVRNHVKLDACNADTLKDKGMELVNMGQHQNALAAFNAALKCKYDPYVLSLAFMAACNAQDSAQAKAYYTKLSPPQQQKLSIMCIRNKTPYQ